MRYSAPAAFSSVKIYNFFLRHEKVWSRKTAHTWNASVSRFSRLSALQKFVFNAALKTRPKTRRFHDRGKVFSACWTHAITHMCAVFRDGSRYESLIFSGVSPNARKSQISNEFDICVITRRLILPFYNNYFICYCFFYYFY